MRLRSILPNKRYLLIYLVVMAVAALLFTPSHFSTNMLDIFPQNRYTQQLADASKLQSLNRLIIISKGSDAASRQRLAAIAEGLKGVDAVDTVFFKVNDLHSPAAAYLRATYAQRLDINLSKTDPAYVRTRLQSLYDTMQSSFLFSGLNTSDPLELFSDPLRSGEAASKNGIALFKGEDYMLTATLNIPVADVDGAQRLHSQVKALTAPYGDEITAYAPHFFTAENSAKIKGEVNLIITATLVLLLLFYALSLRDFKVLLLTSLALGSSLFVGLAVVTTVFEEVSIFTLAFGSGIAMMAVDYFFHYYFHGYYADGEKSRKKVFYAFLTTFSGFVILGFADFPLISELAVFGLAALSFSYFQFSFLFASWRFEPKARRLKLRAPGRGALGAKTLFVVSTLLLVAAVSQLHFNGDLRTLDYQNRALQSLQETIKSAAASEQIVIVRGSSEDDLLQRMEAVEQKVGSFRSLALLGRSHAGFETYRKSVQAADIAALRQTIAREAEKVGFRSGTFAGAYGFADDLTYKAPDLDVAKALGYETLQLDDGSWISLALVGREDAEKLAPFKGVSLLDAADLLQKGVEGVLEQLIVIAVAVFGLIALLLIVLLRQRALVAFNYVLFPLAVIAAALAASGSFSVMHLFALVIVMVAAIDYGIYMSDVQAETDEAIYYAMLTTFAGFGIFVFSNIGALHHIGMVIALGIASTFVLQSLQKRSS